jgi:hypothetical protein
MLGMPEKPRSFATRPANRTIDTAPAAAPAAAPGTASAGHALPAAAPGTSEPTQQRGAQKADAVPGAAPKPGEQPAAAAAPEAEPKPETVTATEESKRIARIHRAEAAHQEKVAADRRAIAEERAAFDRDRATSAERLKRAELIDQIRDKPPASRLKFLQEVFGWQPQQIIDELVAHSQKKPEELQREQTQSEIAAANARLAQLEKERQAETSAREQERAAAQIAQYKTEHIAPVLADRAKYELTHRALGDKAVDEVFSLQRARHDLIAAGKAGRAIPGSGLSAEQAAAEPFWSAAECAEVIEAHFKKQRDTLSGTSAPSAKPPEPTKTDEPPRASASGSQAQKPPNGAGTNFRSFPKPFVRKAVR